jgi:hypothetical protein
MVSIMLSGEDNADVSACTSAAPVPAIDVSEWDRLDSDTPAASACMSLTKAVAP